MCFSLRVSVLILAGFLLANPAASQSYSLTGMGDLAGGTFDSWATGVSSDGSVVVGSGTSSLGRLAVRWQSGTLTALPQLPGGLNNAHAWSVSGNGNAVVGHSEHAAGTEAFRWTSAGGIQGLGTLGGGTYFSRANAISGDATTIVGYSDGPLGTEAFRRTGGSLVGIGDLAGGGYFSQALGVNYDGSVVVGISASANGASEAFRWTSTGGMVGLGDLAGGGFNSVATATNFDGSVVVGTGRTGTTSNPAYRWTAATGMVSIGDLPGSTTFARATGVSADGNVIVGYSQGSQGTYIGELAFIWTPTTGMVSLRAHLIANGVTAASSWQRLQSAWGISADGSTIVGYGLNASGSFEGFIARIPGAAPPAGVADSYAVNTDESLTTAAPGVLGNDTDAAGGIAVLSDAPSSAAAFSLGTDGSFDYTPNPNFVGTDTFTYRIQRNGLTSAAITVTITVRAKLSTWTISPSTVDGGVSLSGTLTILGTAPAGGLPVSLSDNSTAVLSEGVSAVVPAGSSSLVVTIPTATVANDTDATVSVDLNNGSGPALSFTVTIRRLSITELTLQSASATGGGSVSGSLAISSAIGLPTAVALSSNRSEASVPPSVTVQPSGQTASFTVTTAPVSSTTTATITGTLNGTTRTATLDILPPQMESVLISPSSVVAGNSASGTATISSPAPTGGATVALTSNRTNAQVPATVTVPQGSTSVGFSVTTTPVTAQTTATITASFAGSSRTGTLQLRVVQLSSISVAQASVGGGQSTTGTVMLDAGAPGSGASVTLSSNHASVSVPASILVAAGSKTANFTVNTSGVVSVVNATLTSTYNGSSVTCPLEVRPPGLSSLVANPSSVYGGTPTTGTVSLSSAAPSGGIAVALSVSNNRLFLPNGASVTIPAGASSASFPIQTLEVTSTVTHQVRATLNGATLSADIQLRPLPNLTNFTVNPTSVFEGYPSTGTLQLDRAAPPGGSAVTIASVEAGTHFVLPSTVTVPAGQASTTFTIGTRDAGATQVVRSVRATYRGISKVASITIKPIFLANMTVSPTRLVGGGTIFVTVSLTSPAAPAGTDVFLSSTLRLYPPPSVKVPSGATTHTFGVATSIVTVRTSQTITARRNGVVVTRTVTLDPSDIRF